MENLLKEYYNYAENLFKNNRISQNSSNLVKKFIEWCDYKHFRNNIDLAWDDFSENISNMDVFYGAIYPIPLNPLLNADLNHCLEFIIYKNGDYVNGVKFEQIRPFFNNIEKIYKSKLWNKSEEQLLNEYPNVLQFKIIPKSESITLLGKVVLHHSRYTINSNFNAITNKNRKDDFYLPIFIRRLDFIKTFKDLNIKKPNDRIIKERIKIIRSVNI